MRYFMKKNNLKSTIVTSISKSGVVGVDDDMTMNFMPVACYSYTVGENTLNRKVLHCGL